MKTVFYLGGQVRHNQAVEIEHGYLVTIRKLQQHVFSDHILHISRAINKLLKTHSMLLSNCSFMRFNELLFL